MGKIRRRPEVDYSNRNVVAELEKIKARGLPSGYYSRRDVDYYQWLAGAALDMIRGASDEKEEGE